MILKINHSQPFLPSSESLIIFFFLFCLIISSCKFHLLTLSCHWSSLPNMNAEKISAQLNHVPLHSQFPILDPPIHKTHHVFSSIQKNPPEKIPENPKKISQEGEIGVFSAEKYFNMNLDNHSPVQTDAFPGNHNNNQENQDKNYWMRSKSRSGTSSIKSESSYNSQNFLSRNFIKNSKSDLSQNQQRKTKDETVSFGGFRCNGPCSGAKSVNINPNLNDTRTEIHNSRKQIQKPTIHIKNQPRVHVSPRIGDFALPIPIEKADIAVNLEKKLSMLTWDAIPKSQNLTITDEDIASDASSDLFEIENITGAYEPSEASIEWSVATRSMADFSVASDFGEKNKFAERKMKYPNPNPNPKTKSSGAGVGGILSGCKSHRSVNVVEAQRSERKLQGGVRVSDLGFL